MGPLIYIYLIISHLPNLELPIILRLTQSGNADDLDVAYLEATDQLLDKLPTANIRGRSEASIPANSLTAAAHCSYFPQHIRYRLSLCQRSGRI